MKATILNGMHKGDELCLATQQNLVTLMEDKGWKVESFVLYERAIRPCAGCFGCWIKTPGQCVMDDANDIAQAFVQSDLAVFLTPVTFGGYSSELKKAVDHLIGNILPFFRTIDGETHHKARYKDYPNLLGVGILPSPDEHSERLFTNVVRRNAINMFSPLWATGFISTEQHSDHLRPELQSMLAEVGIGQ